ncbi:MAG: hypothetical protein AAF208_13975 [Cyanobacteria bacterium P01_A01_bin.45]
MFPFWDHFCCASESTSYQTHQERKLTFLKRMRDHLETRLAALNAAIESVERQMNP